NMQSYMADAIKGIGYRLKIDEKGKIKGLQAYDMTPNKSLSAAENDALKIAQDKADAHFYKGGLFKLPYIGTAAEKLMSNTLLGSTALSMLTSPIKTVRTVVDLAYDHGIITKELKEGTEKPIPFFTLLNQTLAHIKAEEA